MKNYQYSLAPKHEYMLEDLVIGASETTNYLYSRATTASPNGYTTMGMRSKMPSMSQLNWFGRKMDIEFMLRHQLPATLADGVAYFTPSQLPKGIYFRDDTLGRFYRAEPSEKMINRAARRHYVAWPKIALEHVQPEQRIIRSITITDQKALKDYKKWHKELLDSEEAINILEPGYEKAKSGKQIVFTYDFCAMLRQAYLDNLHPASVLANLRDRWYEIPHPESVGIGTRLGFHTFLVPV